MFSSVEPSVLLSAVTTPTTDINTPTTTHLPLTTTPTNDVTIPHHHMKNHVVHTDVIEELLNLADDLTNMELQNYDDGTIDGKIPRNYFYL